MKTTPQILVIKLSALGDFVQALGPMQAIRKHHKDAHITLITSKGLEKIGRECGYFDDIIIDNKPSFIDLTGWLSLRSIMNKGNFDRVYDLQNNDRTSLYFKLFKNPKPEWVGTAKGASHRNVNPLRTAGHAFDGHAQTLNGAGIKTVKIDNLSWMDNDISAFDLPARYALIIPGCAPSPPEKRWPEIHFSALCNALTAKNITPVLIGGSDEVEIGNAICEQSPKTINLITKTVLTDIPALARKAALAIGNDTGPMHFIGPAGCKSLVLFSSHSDPVRHKPLGPNVETIQKENIDDITPEDIIERVEQMINI